MAVFIITLAVMAGLLVLAAGVVVLLGYLRGKKGNKNVDLAGQDYGKKDFFFTAGHTAGKSGNSHGPM